MEYYTVSVMAHFDITVEADDPEEAQDMAYNLTEDGDLTAAIPSGIEVTSCTRHVPPARMSAP